MILGRSTTSTSSTAAFSTLRSGTVKRRGRFPGRISTHVCPSRRRNFSVPAIISCCLSPSMCSIDRSLPDTGIDSHGISGSGTPQSSNSKGEFTAFPVEVSTKSRQYSAADRDPGNSLSEYLDSGIGRTKTNLSSSKQAELPGLAYSQSQMVPIGHTGRQCNKRTPVGSI